jgi:hypothetical protein
MHKVGKITRGMFGAAIVGVLCFGASGALAAPVEASRRICKPSNLPQCQADCIAAGAWTGVCSGGECECLW